MFWYLAVSSIERGEERMIRGLRRVLRGLGSIVAGMTP